MNSSSKKRKIIATVAVGGHILTIFILWLILRENNIQEPVFQKVISAQITTAPPSINNLPVLDQATRDKIEKEKRQKEESEWKQQQNNLKKKHEAEVKKLKEAEAKKKLAEKKTEKKPEPKKKEEKKPEKKKDDSKKKLAEKTKAEELKKQKAEEARKKRAKELAEKRRHEKMLADKRAKEAADRAASQANLGKHVTTDIVTRLTQEWTRLRFSAIEFNDPNDIVKIEFKIRRDGSLISARVAGRAKSSNLNAKAAALIKTISGNGYKFPPFDPQYNKTSITITRSFGTR